MNDHSRYTDCFIFSCSHREILNNFGLKKNSDHQHFKPLLLIYSLIQLFRTIYRIGTWGNLINKYICILQECFTFVSCTFFKYRNATERKHKIEVFSVSILKKKNFHCNSTSIYKLNILLVKVPRSGTDNKSNFRTCF